MKETPFMPNLLAMSTKLESRRRIAKLLGVCFAGNGGVGQKDSKRLTYASRLKGLALATSRSRRGS